MYRINSSSYNSDVIIDQRHGNFYVDFSINGFSEGERVPVT